MTTTYMSYRLVLRAISCVFLFGVLRLHAQISVPSVGTSFSSASCSSGTSGCVSSGVTWVSGNLKATVTDLTETSCTIQTGKCSLTFVSGTTLYVRETSICNSNSITNGFVPSGDSRISLTFAHNLSYGDTKDYYVTTPNTSGTQYFSNKITLSRLGQPTLASPTNAAIYPYDALPTSIRFSWNKNNNSGIANYSFKLVDATTNTTLVSEASNSADVNSYTFNNTSSLEAGHSYRWVVVANRIGSQAERVEAQNFTFSISSPPVLLMPTLVSPSNNTTYSYNSIPPTIQFRWNKNNNLGIATYALRLRDVTDNVVIVNESSNGSDVDYYDFTNNNNLIAGHSYQWVVVARRQGSTETRDAQNFSFSISSPPALGQPILLSPSDGYSYSSMPSNIPFSWNRNNDPGIANYSFKLVEYNITTGATTQIIVDESTNSSDVSSYNFTNTNQLLAGRNYRWVVVANRIGLPAERIEANAFVFNIQAAPVTCSGCTAWTNPPTAGTPECVATARLCQDGIIVPNQNGSFNRSNGIKRQELALIVFRVLTGVRTPSVTASNIPSNTFPSPFPDLQDPTRYWYQAFKMLSYLDYGDGITPFSRNRTMINPDDSISRRDALKVFAEAFNLKKRNNNSLPFNDVFTTDETYSFIKAAYDNGLLDNNASFRPTAYMTREEAFIVLNRILVTQSISVSVSRVLDISNYFVPTDCTPINMALLPSLAQGNFNNYEKSGFNIKGRALPLDFDFSYSSYLTELPTSFFGDKAAHGEQIFNPLGAGWTHTYNIYIQRKRGFTYNDETNTQRRIDDRLLIFWSNGTFNVYNETQNSYETQGLYHDLVKTSGGNIIEITNKTQITYRFILRGGMGIDFYSLESIRDRNGHQLNLTYQTTTINNQTVYRLTKVQEQTNTGTLGRFFTISYPSNSQYINKVEESGLNRTILFSVNNGGDLTEFTDAKSQTTTYSYGSSELESHLLKTITLPKGNTITNTYLQRKLRSSETNRNSTTQRTSKTEVNWQNAYSNSNGATSTVSQIQNNQTLTTNYSFDNQGREIQSKSPTTRINATYPTDVNNQFRPVSLSIANADGTSPRNVALTYDTKGNPTRIERTYTEGGTTKKLVELTSYTSLNDVSFYTDPRGKITELQYIDNNKNLWKVIRPYQTTTELFYNEFKQVSQIRNPEGIDTYFAYDQNGNRREVRIGDIIQTANYDNASRLIATVDANNKISRLGYDYNDNTTSATDPLGNLTSYAYDANDNCIKITDAKGQETVKIHSFEEDFLSSETFGGQTKTYTYYQDGTLATMARHTRLFNYQYNGIGQLISDGKTDYSYDSRNHLQQIIYQNRKISLTYDDLDRVIGHLYMDNNRSNSESEGVLLEFDNNNNVIAKIYQIRANTTLRVNYEYDDLNRVKKVVYNNVVVEETFYKKDGRVDYIVYGNGTKKQYNYDDIGRMIGFVNLKANGTVINSTTFTLDKVGNHLSENTTDPLLATALSRLQNQNVTYGDYPSNRITRAGTTNFTVNEFGNVSQKGNEQYTYDDYDRLTQVVGGTNPMSATYDPMGNRHSLTRNGITTNFVLDLSGLSQVVAEKDASNNVLNYYIYGATGLICRIKPDATTTHYYHADFRGSIVAMTDANQNITHKYAYDPYGLVIAKEEPTNDVNPFRYVGQYGVMYDDSLRYYMRARYYDPSVGRFISEDPVWGTNLYAYVDGNPIVGIDPDGRVNKWRVAEGGLDVIVGVGTLFISGFTGVGIVAATWSGTIGIAKIISGLVEKDDDLEARNKLFDKLPSSPEDIAATIAGFVLKSENTSKYGEKLSNLAKSAKDILSFKPKKVLDGFLNLYNEILGSSTTYTRDKLEANKIAKKKKK